MLTKVRTFFNETPIAGWAVAGVILLVSVFIFMRGQSGTDPYSPERMREMVTIRYSDTGDEVTIPRGQMDKELRLQGAHIDPAKGLINPKTGQPTGFLFNKEEWNEMIARINQDKAESKGRSAFSPKGPSAPAEPK